MDQLLAGRQRVNPDLETGSDGFIKSARWRAVRNRGAKVDSFAHLAVLAAAMSVAMA
jgi:hypothetical protein